MFSETFSLTATSCGRVTRWAYQH